MRKLLTAAVLTAITLPAYADPYFILGIGQAKIKANVAEFDNLDTLNEKGTAFSFGLGHQVNENVSIEFTYNNYGDVSDVIYKDAGSYYYASNELTADVEITSFALSTKFSTTPVNGVNVYGRIGLEIWETCMTLTDAWAGYADDVYKDRDSGNDMFFGLGIAAILNDQATLNFEYSFHTADSEFSDEWIDSDIDIDVRVLSVSALFKF